MADHVKLDMFLALEEKVEKRVEMREKELFEIPEGWIWVKIKDVVRDFQSGFACSKTYATEEGIPHLRPNNIGFYGKLDFSHLVFIPPKRVDLSKYSLRKGDVLFNNTNSKELVGRACLVEEDMDYAFSNHITRLRVNKQLITPGWMVLSINYLWLKGYFLSICRKWIGQAGVNIRMLKSTKIPLPRLEDQKRIVTRVEKLISRVKEARRLKEIAIEESEKIMQAALNKVFNEAKEKWGLTRLVRICKINPSKNEIRALPDDTQVTFVPMAAVSEITGKIEKPEIKLLGEVRKGYTYFKENDVLFAKITPCMENGKSAIAKNLINGLGFGSTEFHVLRPLNGVLSSWIYYYIRQKLFRDYAARNMTGSVGQQRVPVQFLKNVEIPYPPIEEQKRFTAYLNKIRETLDSLRRLQQRTEEELEKLIPSILDRAFKGML
jgi:type I restriction enzyme S subunit